MSVLLVLGTVSMQAQTSAAGPTKTTHKRVVKKKAAVESTIEREIRELREQLQSQQAQIDSLKQQNAEKDAKLATASQDAQAANAAAAQATSQAAGVSSSVQANTDAVTTLNSTVNDLKTANTGLTQTISETKKDLTAKIESPLAMHYKGITITPVAFFAAGVGLSAAVSEFGCEYAFQRHSLSGSGAGAYQRVQLLRSPEPAGWVVRG